MTEDLEYQSGYGNEFATEALDAALPKDRNNPQRCPYGLFAEQLSGSAFTAPRGENRRSWLYRIRPSVLHGPYERIEQGSFVAANNADVILTPEQLRWDPLDIPKQPTDFVEGIKTICVNGDPSQRSGSAVHLYSCNKDMTDKSFVNADGEFLVVPQLGELSVLSEFGRLSVVPNEILLIPRGVKFSINPVAGKARGYICENYGAFFELPNRGPIGANGLANERHFLTPVAWYEESHRRLDLVTKFLGELWTCELSGSPYDVVAWAGNYAPFKYNLTLFNTINTVSYDHPDPSIFTVLTSPSGKAGTANVDFVIFPPRWMVAEDTFRPPYYHRNVMSEYMGLIHGIYDAKPAGGGFVPGGGSLHNCMSAHGPDAQAFKSASESELKPEYLGDTLAFMFESNLVYQTTRLALETSLRQKGYLDCWQSLKPHFNASKA